VTKAPAAPGVALIRVDNRLVHGQVLEAWLPALDAHGILVADDEAAGNVLARSAMALAIPPKVSFQVLRVAAAAELLRPGGQGPQRQRTLVLLRDVRDAVQLHELGVPIPRLNLGNVHFAAGRRQVSPSVFLDDGEVRSLERLAATGTQVEVRAVPTEEPLPLAGIRSRHGAPV
jgi:mannose/fructose/N-acetylgalactosamine-specific phosphotransferase system component IIB